MHCFSALFALKVLGHSFTLQFLWKNMKMGKMENRKNTKTNKIPTFLCQTTEFSFPHSQYWTNSGNACMNFSWCFFFFLLRVCSAAYNVHFWCSEIVGLLVLCWSTKPPGFLCSRVPLWTGFRRRALLCLLRLLNASVCLHVQLMELHNSVAQLPDGCLVAVNLAWICLSAEVWWYFYGKCA